MSTSAAAAGTSAVVSRSAAGGPAAAILRPYSSGNDRRRQTARIRVKASADRHAADHSHEKTIRHTSLQDELEERSRWTAVSSSDQYEPSNYVRLMWRATEDRGKQYKGRRIDVDELEVGDDDDRYQLEMLEAELRLLASVAEERAETHAILAQQRDGWNKLFQATLTAASLTAAVLAALNGAAHTSQLSVSLPALLLNAGSGLMMVAINKFQPSQLAEEQRAATRFFRKLAGDLRYALHVSPSLRQEGRSLLRESQARLYALDRAFPMPLTPGGLEKFPDHVCPPLLRSPALRTTDRPAPAAETDQLLHDDTAARISSSNINVVNINGWSRTVIRDLTHTAALLRRSDISTYTSWAQNVVKVNKCLAIAAPSLAFLAAACNAVSSIGALNAPGGHHAIFGLAAAVCSVLATFAGSFSHDMQLGMVMEMYRNSAGHYAEIEASIAQALSTPLEHRENGRLLRQRVAYQLGRPAPADDEPLVPAGSSGAGTLF